MTRRILHIVDTLERGTAGLQLSFVAAGLPRDRFDTHVCALSGGALSADFEQHQIPLTVVGDSDRFDIGAWWRLRRLVARLKPDLVHTWGPSANLHGRTAARAAGRPTLVATKRGAGTSLGWHHAVLESYLDRHTETIIVNSRASAESLVRLANLRSLRVIPLGVAQAESNDCTRESMLAELGLPPNARIAGTVCSLVWGERIKDLIWAADLLKVIRDDVHLVIIGEGPQRAVFERYSHLCHVDRQVHFLGHRDDVSRVVPHFDVFWLAGGRESTSIGVLQAMAAGVPAVAGDVAANRELIVPSESGYLVPRGDRAGFARLANSILDDASLARRLGSAAKARISEEFGVESMVARHVAVYGGDRDSGLETRESPVQAARC